ncbi:MAG: hypothetical protein M0Z41_05085 [Peptococcaceae bacterium]|jgi:hypothetical protein|nr:hypothetical protein [Peptococcaceae bacterium]
MALPSDINFAPGVTVNISMNNGQIFTGELVNAPYDYIQLKLTAATGPYVVGQVVLLNEAEITSVG